VAAGGDRPGDGLLIGHHHVRGVGADGGLHPRGGEPGQGEQKVLPQELEGGRTPHPGRPIALQRYRISPQLLAGRQQDGVVGQQRLEDHRRSRPRHLVAPSQQLRADRHRRIDMAVERRHHEQDAGHAQLGPVGSVGARWRWSGMTGA